MRSFHKKEQGFTLIEIVIVLAIAAAIMLLVFLAVSGAQKTKRDTATKSAAGQLSAQIEHYMSNNAGLAPAANMALGGNYIGNIKSGQGNAPVPASAGNAATAANPIKYSGNMKCTTPNGSGVIIAGTAAQYAVSYYLESTGSNVCIDNQ
jgi:prepilin-type N-terminal cleavage/methylation domain-containing protein